METIMFFIMTWYLEYILILIKDSSLSSSDLKTEKNELIDPKIKYTYFKSILMLLVGVFLLKYGADFLVNSAINIAEYFEIPERIIAVTIVAIGTSVPELAASIIAAVRNQDSLAIGNLIGSNVFNIFAVLGFTAVIKPINMLEEALFSFDTICMIGITILLGVIIYFSKKKYLFRKEGLVLFISYLVYIYITLN